MKWLTFRCNDQIVNYSNLGDTFIDVVDCTFQKLKRSIDQIYNSNNTRLSISIIECVLILCLLFPVSDQLKPQTISIFQKDSERMNSIRNECIQQAHDICEIIVNVVL